MPRTFEGRHGTAGNSWRDHRTLWEYNPRIQSTLERSLSVLAGQIQRNKRRRTLAELRGVIRLRTQIIRFPLSLQSIRFPCKRLGFLAVFAWGFPLTLSHCLLDLDTHGRPKDPSSSCELVDSFGIARAHCTDSDGVGNHIRHRKVG